MLKAGLVGSGRFRRLFEKFDLNRAVMFALLTRACQAVSGVVSLILIAHFFRPEIQGYYYTFLSLVALQVFVELGLYLVILSRASHEWSVLGMTESGSIVGDRRALSRLASLAGFVAKWYAGASLLFAVGAGLAGHVFLSSTDSVDVAWKGPWWTATVVAAAQLWLMPFVSLLEGCNQVEEVNRFRFVQVVSEALAMWGLIAAGAALWVAAGSLAVRLSVTLWFLVGRYYRFFLTLAESAGQEKIRWRLEVWPMQWRLAVQGVVNYFMFSLFNPIMFHYHGPTVAGQTGMTLQIINVAQGMGFAWVQTKVPRFGSLVAARDFAGLDRLWRNASMLSFGFTVFGSLGIWAAVLILNASSLHLASRMLEPLPTALFLIAFAFLQVSSYQAAYLRAYAREPFLLVGVLGGISSGTLVFLLGSRFGPAGAAAAFAATTALLVLPMSTVIWMRRRREWQSVAKE